MTARHLVTDLLSGLGWTGLFAAVIGTGWVLRQAWRERGQS